MKAVAVAMLTYFRVFPIQRWVGVGTLAVAALVAVSRSPGAIAFVVVAVACLMFAVLGPLGLLFREISAVRSHRFLPHFRARMLIAVVLVVAFFPTVGYVLLSFAPRGPPAAAPWFAFAVLIASAWVWFTFFLRRSLLAAVAAPIGALLYSSVGPSPYLVPAIGVALCVGWIAFVTWYLRAPAIAPGVPVRGWAQHRPSGWLERLDALLSDRSGRFTPGSAIGSWLTGRYPTRPLAGAALLAVLQSLAWSLVLRGKGLDRPDLFIAAACAAMLPVLIAVANNAARRARCLWLHGAKTRRELFAAVERNLWNGPLFAYLVGLTGFAAFARLVFAVDLLWQAIPTLIGGCVLAAYLGLACVRRVVLVSWLSTVLVVGLGFTAISALDSGHLRAFAGIVALELGAALAARAIAIRLWERIDWIVLRPPRMTVARGRATR
jgi:hypothetical protein